ncbi:hypothetical protein H7J51_05330 [Mycobacterium crocinum]|uniref:Uncharacterized protein n=1 Tax=Mycolicibacterium crocinum TaxID=388459 RepID=A0ABY3TLL2_9MYCO|nr:hypothetical protein [Mycolicibacterium crocinum]MCV7214706.1 hypothetical protein [Mycolicibacterium crocinum]ULN41607.1 hypothetical protein MI149_00110 [Mycolicibacterium crocinum]
MPRPRFETIAEMRASKPPSDRDITAKAVKMKADANVAIARIDKALGNNSVYYTKPTGASSNPYRPGSSEHQSWEAW